MTFVLQHAKDPRLVQDDVEYKSSLGFCHTEPCGHSTSSSEDFIALDWARDVMIQSKSRACDRDVSPWLNDASADEIPGSYRIICWGGCLSGANYKVPSHIKSAALLATLAL